MSGVERFPELLKRFKIEHSDTTTPHTHTRIGDSKLKISGGKYSVPEEELDNFYRSYFEHVFERKRPEYMTEKQLEDDGPILVDFDFRYLSSVKTRQHTHEHIFDLIQAYLDKIKTLINFKDKCEFPIFIFEKDKVNSKENVTKDGIHMIIGLKMRRQMQLLLREKIKHELSNILESLPLKDDCDHDQILDEGITKGHVNWQLFGSRKPGNDSYKLKYYYKVEYDPADDDTWEMEKVPIEQLSAVDILPLVSARNSDHILLKPKPQALKESQKFVIKKKNKKRTKLKLKTSATDLDWSDFETMEELDKILETQFNELPIEKYYLKEVHDYTMVLPKQYYQPGSHDKWLKVGMALFHTDKSLFPTWMKFSSQSEEFDFKDVPVFYDKWMEFSGGDGLTSRSIIYWVKEDNPKEYKRVKDSTVDHYVEETLNGSTDFDIANVLYQLFKDRFVCISIKNNIWYEYKNHRWFENDSGNSLRLSVSKDLFQIYLKKLTNSVHQMQQLSQDDDQWTPLRKRATKFTDIGQNLKKTQHKNNIMREAREIFYDPYFLEKLDSNNYLLGFKNGIIDFKEKCFRPGRPEDYVSKCTNIDYVPLRKTKQKKEISEIKDFMEQLFPVESLNKYMWEHLASCLLGTNKNQTFNIYTGCGSNGKSKLVELMSMILGEYKGSVPITLITQKRQSIGSTSSEIVQLKGTRYAVMQEPSKGARINEGIMKEITGGDPIQGRALFKDTITFVPQFKLVVCTNVLFDIGSNDDGTWRRIRVCDFMSKFVDKPSSDDDEQNKYHFPKDKNIDNNFKRWAPVFMSMLVELAYEKQGDVEDCELVMATSNQYREGQDYLAEFVKDKIQKKQGSKIKKTALTEEFKKWYTLQYGRRVPKGKELYDFMNKKYGQFKNGWHNIELIYDEEEEEDEIEGCIIDTGSNDPN